MIDKKQEQDELIKEVRDENEIHDNLCAIVFWSHPDPLPNCDCKMEGIEKLCTLAQDLQTSNETLKLLLKIKVEEDEGMAEVQKQASILNSDEHIFKKVNEQRQRLIIEKLNLQAENKKQTKRIQNAINCLEISDMGDIKICATVYQMLTEDKL